MFTMKLELNHLVTETLEIILKMTLSMNFKETWRLNLYYYTLSQPSVQDDHIQTTFEKILQTELIPKLCLDALGECQLTQAKTF